jgi:hypothetical protein
MGTARRTLQANSQETIRGLVARQGQVATAAAFGISPQTLAALTAGFRVHPAIVEAVEKRLAEREKAGES